ncbi:MAG: peroxidase family protein [Woeseiaceae bacterium]
MPKNHGMNEQSGFNAFCHHGHKRQRGDRFGRLFEIAPLFTPAPVLHAIGAQGGPMDGGASAKRTQTVDVGQIFFGQFVDHDITLDISTSLSSVVSDEGEIENARTPTLDLDCIYGQGPEATPFLYHGQGDFKGIKLLTGKDGTAAEQSANLAKNDLSRTPHGVAIIGDPRNDENRIISQLQLAMLRFHNKVVDQLKSKYSNGELYEEARRLVTWHYQWVVIHDYLPAICGNAVVADILGNGRQFYCAEDNDPFIPIEFSVAAYRFGHSMIPQKVQIQKANPAHALFGSILGKGFVPLSSPKGVVDWRELVDTNQGRSVQKAEKLDSDLATILLKLPFIKSTDTQSLATRNLLRGQTFQLPSGENVAVQMDRSDAEIKKVSDAADDLAAKASVELASGTPLWLYILLEAEKIGRESHVDHFDKAEGLGPVGARIVAETILGLIELDPRSFLAQNRSWQPEDGVGVATLGEMLTY